MTLLSASAPGQAPDVKLAATLYVPESRAEAPAPGLIVGHGAGSCRAHHEDFCRQACGRGLVVLALDFRGHGDSGGAADGPLEQDVFAAARYLRVLPAVDSSRLAYRGSSMGGFYGLKSAAQVGFAAMVLICPASEDIMLRAVISGEATDRWDAPRLRSYFEQQDSRVLASQVDCPVLLVHARGDEVVPVEHSLWLAKHMRKETTVLVLEGGSHGTAQHDPEAHGYSVAWLAAKLIH